MLLSKALNELIQTYTAVDQQRSFWCVIGGVLCSWPPSRTRFSSARS